MTPFIAFNLGILFGGIMTACGLILYIDYKQGGRLR
jgi:hypothetical protein